MMSESKKITIALYSLYDHEPNIKIVDEWIEEDPDYTKCSNEVEVEFTLLSKEEVIPKIIKGLDSKISKIRGEAQVKVDAIEKRKSEILAITDQSETGFDDIPF